MTGLSQELDCSKDKAWSSRDSRPGCHPETMVLGGGSPGGQGGTPSLHRPLSGLLSGKVGADFPLNREHFDRGH